MKAAAFLLCAAAAQTIVKALTDPRTHHFFVHGSGMKVYITEDDATQKCGAALRVNAGYLSDPAEWAGLANLVMRSLFLGSAKHPALNKLSDLVGEGGGFSNGYLYEDATSFTFDVRCEQLEEALDVFASLFLAPTFNEEGVRNELGVIEDEFKQHAQLEQYRRARLLASLANPKSPYTKFGSGNARSLDRPGLLQAMRAFFEAQYKPSRFTLAVYGREAAATEELARRLFAGLKADGALPPSYGAEPFFGPAQLNRLVRVKSLHEESTMEITVFFSQNEARMATKPLDLLKHWLENPYRGSFIRKARQWGWITDAQVDVSTLINNYAEFSIAITLTPGGMRRHEDVRALFFESTRFLADNLQPYLYEDYRAARTVQFEYASVGSPMATVLELVQNSAVYPTEKVLAAPYELGPFAPAEIAGVLRAVAPANALVILSSAGFDGLTDVEAVFGTEFSVEALKARKAPDFGAMRLPPRALFRPSLKALAAKTASGRELREVVHPQPKDVTPPGYGREARLWHYRDVTFGLPFFAATFDLHLDEQFLRGAEALAAHEILVEMVEREISQLQYTLRLFNSQTFFSLVRSGFQLHVEGISPALHDAVKTTLGFLKRFLLTAPLEPEFDVQRLKMLQKAADDRKAHLRSYARKAWGWVAFRGEVSDEEREAAFAALTFAAFQQHFANFSKKMFAEVLITGDVSAAQAVDVFESGVAILKTRLTAALRPAEVRLFDMSSSALLLLPNPSAASHTSSVALHYYLGTEIESKAFVHVLAMAIAEKFFTDLRIKQKSGYAVVASPISASGHQLFRFAVESTLSPAEELLQRILDFIAREAQTIAQMTAAQFQTYQQGAQTDFLQPFTDISSHHSYMYDQISRHHDNSNNQQEVLRKINALDLDTFKAKFHQVFVEQPKRFTLIFSNKKDLPNTEKELRKATKGNDRIFLSLKEYQASRDVYPDLHSLRKKLEA